MSTDVTSARPQWGNARAAFLLAALAGVACGIGSGHDTSLGPRGECLGAARSVVLVPLAIRAEIDVAEHVAAEFDSIINVEVRHAGFSVVSAEEYSAAWERIVQVMGGLVDTVTGEWDEMRYEIAREQLVRDLSDAHDFDLVLRPEIWIVDAPFSGGIAEWDGTSESLVGFGTRLFDAISSFLNQVPSALPGGTLPAASLGIVVEDLDGSELCSGAGGIQVIEKVGHNWRDWRPVPDSDLFTDPDRNARAVRTAVARLLRGSSG